MMIGCIIQARMGSTRLPEKVMKTLEKNVTVLDFVIEQINKSKFIDKIIIATTTLSEDDVIEDHVKSLGISVFRGKSHDVLDRYYQCGKKFNLPIIVRITSDCPLIDPEISDLVISKFDPLKYDYVCNTHPRTFPQGTETEIFSFKSLKIAWKNAKLPSEREHVTPFFYNNKNKFRILNVKNEEDLSNLRWCLDRKEDLIVLRKIVSTIKSRPILTKHILNMYKMEPKVFEKNKRYSALEGYMKSLNDDVKFLHNQN